MFVSPTTSVLRPVGVAVVVLLALALAPGRASAACGDYVTIEGGATGPLRAEHPGADRHDPKPPCHGPNCSSRPSTPFSPPPAPVSQVSDVKACAIGSVGPTVTESRAVELPSAGLAPVDRPAPVYHPPRA